MTVKLLHNTPLLRECKCGTKAYDDEDLALFIKGKKYKYGRQNECNKCYSDRNRERNRIGTARIRMDNKDKGLEYVKQYYGFPFKCMACGYTSELFAPFDLHHRDRETKEGTPSQLFKQSFDRFKKEADKCDLVCACCHRIEHYKERNNEC